MPRILTELELNRALLARQLLLERSKLPIPRALERVAGIQAQYAPSSYVGLWTRLARFGRADLDRALRKRSVVQGTLMRATIHLVSRRDYWPFALAVGEPLAEWFLRTTKQTHQRDQLMETDRRARAILAEGPRRRKELIELLGGDPAVWRGVGLWTPLVRVPPSGTWAQRRADLYGVAEDWLGPPSATREEGVRHLIRRYLGGFGPASRDDIASFTRLPRAEVGAALQSMPVRTFRSGSDTTLFDVPRAPLPDPDTPAPPRFLPTWDASLLVHARRTGILPERYRPAIFTSSNPQSFSTFLVDGRVAGTWRFDGRRIELDPFEPLPRRVRRDLEGEARMLAALHA